jgi:dihydrofolate reductase
MGAVVLDMAVSLDGFVAGPNNEDGGLYDWYFTPTASGARIRDELIESTGAMILGKRAFGSEPEGFDTPYKIPHFVLSHTPQAPISREGMQFIFVNDGIESALAQARAAAGDKAVCIAGGAATARQFIGAGLVDEIQLHLVNVLLGDGLRLFERTAFATVQLERTRVVENEGVTHLRFRVVR